MAHHCKEFSRSSLLRQGIAEAGRGLPAIEPGMPEPAGTGLSRRSFVAKSLGMALAVYGAGRLNLFDEGIANAAAGRPAPILVSVFLQGGADSLSMLYPDGDPLYHTLRTQLAVTGGTPFTEDTRLFWNPALSPLSQLHDEGKVTVLPAVGYDLKPHVRHPDRLGRLELHPFADDARERRVPRGREIPVGGARGPTLHTARERGARVGGDRRGTAQAQRTVDGGVRRVGVDLCAPGEREGASAG